MSRFFVIRGRNAMVVGARIFIALAFVASLAIAASADGLDVGEKLYKAETIVTGKGEVERARGFREGLKEIFIKLTGDPSLEESEKLEPFLSDAASYIAEYTYEDRMKHLPVRDEQGTRDRPHFLRMTADAAKIEAGISGMGLELWRGRPEIDVLLTVKDYKRSFILGAEASEATGSEAYMGYTIANSRYDGYEQREVLKSIARRRGLTLNLPDAAALAQLLTPAPRLCSSCSTWGSPERKSVRYRGDLSVLPSGLWRLNAQAWGSSPDGAYADAPACFSFEMLAMSFDTALRKSLDAFAAWVRRDKNAPLCGLYAKI